MGDLDNIIINFDEGKLFWINAVLAIVMYAVALEIKLTDFKEVFQKPRMILAGVSSQFLLLPLITLAFVYFVPMQASIALGLFLVSACPGGNTSNFYSMMAKGNIALSVSLTSIAILVSGFMIPISFIFWSGLSSKATPLLTEIKVDYWGMMVTTFWLLVLPLILGILTRYIKPNLADKLSNPLKYFSMLIFAALVIGAFLTNFTLFTELFHKVFWIALFHNGIILLLAYFWGYLFKLKHKERKTISIETGIQNSGIGLVLAFNFFAHLGGMQIIIAWWGIWHLVSGAVVSYIYSRR